MGTYGDGGIGALSAGPKMGSSVTLLSSMSMLAARLRSPAQWQDTEDSLLQEEHRQGILWDQSCVGAGVVDS